MERNGAEKYYKAAQTAKSPEELTEIAKEAGIGDFSEENAKAYFETMHKSGELSDSEMDVSAGGCLQMRSGGRIIVTHLNSCEHFVCKNCGRDYKATKELWYAHGNHFPDGLCSNQTLCRDCKYFIYQSGLWLCNCAEHNNE